MSLVAGLLFSSKLSKAADSARNNYIMLIYKLSKPLEVGYEVDTTPKAHSFVFCEPVRVANSLQNFPVSTAEKYGRWGKKMAP